MDKGSTPQAPDPAKVIPLQGQENRNTFDYQTYQGRTNVNTPYGSSTWTRNPVFDETGYNAAMAAWNSGSHGTGGTWVPEVPGYNSGGDGGQYVQTVPGHWEGGTGPTGGQQGAEPNRADFTNYSWTNNQTYNPREQGIFDANRDSAATVAGSLGGLTDKAMTSLNGSPDYSGVVGPQGEIDQISLQNLRDWGLLSDDMDPSKLPSYARYGDEARLGQVRSGDINRGNISMGYNEVNAPDAKVRDWTSLPGFGPNVRDWAGGLGGDIMSTIGQLKSLDPWAFDQEGADASYNQATRYLDVSEGKQKSQMEARLAEQGFVPGTPAYNQAMAEFMNSSNLARADARDRATLAGRQFGDQAFDNRSGALGSALTGLLNYGDLGVTNDQARDKSFLDMAGFGLKNDEAMSDEALNIAKFLSGERQFGANYGLKAQGQDFDQQKYLSEQERTRGLDANDVVKSQIGLDRGVIDQGNKVAGQEYTDYTDLMKANDIFRGNNANRAKDAQQLNLDAVAQNNETRKQGREEAQQDWQQPITALLTALGLSKPGEIPGSSTAQTGNIGSTDIASLFQNQYNGQIAGANADTASANTTMTALAGIIAAVV